MTRLPTPDDILGFLRDNPGQTAQARHRPRLRAEGRRQGRAEAAARADDPRRPDREEAPPRPAPRATCRRCWSCASPAPTPRATSGPSRPSGRAPTAAAHPGPGPPRRPRARRRRPAARAHGAARHPRAAARRPRHPPHRHGPAPHHRHLPRGRDRRPHRRHRQAHRPRLAGGARRPRRRPRGRAGRGRADRRCRAHGLPRARVIARLGDPSAPKAVSLIAIHEHGIPDEFPDAALAEAEAAQPVPLGAREDLRALPLVTIDPSDARDHDDAVFAAPDDDPANPGGHVVWVAIADVAHLRPPRQRARPRGPPPRQLDLLPRPRRPDAARAALRRPLLADRRRRPPLHRRPPDARRRRPRSAATASPAP